MQNPPPDPSYQAPYTAPGSVHGKSSTGLDANIAAAIAYLFGWVSGLIFYLIEKESRYVRFHAMQSILLSAGFTVLWIVLWIVGAIFGRIPAVGFVFALLIGLLSFVFWLALIAAVIYCLIKAFQGKDFKLPVIGARR